MVANNAYYEKTIQMEFAAWPVDGGVVHNENSTSLLPIVCKTTAKWFNCNSRYAFLIKQLKIFCIQVRPLKHRSAKLGAVAKLVLHADRGEVRTSAFLLLNFGLSCFVFSILHIRTFICRRSPILIYCTITLMCQLS